MSRGLPGRLPASPFHASGDYDTGHVRAPRRRPPRPRRARAPEALRRGHGRGRARPRRCTPGSASGCWAPTAPARPPRSRSARASSRRTAATCCARRALGRGQPRRSAGAWAFSCRRRSSARSSRSRETVRLFRSFFPRGRPVDEVIALVQLEEKRGARVGTLSRRAEAAAVGGVRAGRRPRAAVPRRADHRPRPAVAPPAVGPRRAPQGRRRTIMLTTHYMDEAERLCDRVAIVDHGRVIALGTPRELIRSLGAEQVVECAGDGGRRAARWRPCSGCRACSAPSGRGSDGDAAGRRRRTRPSRALLAYCRRTAAPLTELRTHSPTLEDVFVSLTGRRLREEAMSDAGSGRGARRRSCSSRSRASASSCASRRPCSGSSSSRSCSPRGSGSRSGRGRPTPRAWVSVAARVAPRPAVVARWPATRRDVDLLDDTRGGRGAPRRERSRSWWCRAAPTAWSIITTRRAPSRAPARLVVDRAVQRAGGRATRSRSRDAKVSERGSRYIDFVLPGLLGDEPHGERHLGDRLRDRRRAPEAAAQALRRDAHVARAVPGVVPALPARAAGAGGLDAHGFGDAGVRRAAAGLDLASWRRPASRLADVRRDRAAGRGTRRGPSRGPRDS